MTLAGSHDRISRVRERPSRPLSRGAGLLAATVTSLGLWLVIIMAAAASL